MFRKLSDIFTCAITKEVMVSLEALNIFICFVSHLEIQMIQQFK